MALSRSTQDALSDLVDRLHGVEEKLLEQAEDLISIRLQALREANTTLEPESSIVQKAELAHIATALAKYFVPLTTDISDEKRELLEHDAAMEFEKGQMALIGDFLAKISKKQHCTLIVEIILSAINDEAVYDELRPIQEAYKRGVKGNARRSSLIGELLMDEASSPYR